MARCLLCALGLLLSISVFAQERTLSHPRSGFEFLGAEVKAMQQDDFSNPGMFWVDHGEKLWVEPAGASGVSCQSCHGDAAKSMKGVAARYPAIDAKTGRLMTLEQRILNCRTGAQHAKAPAYESEELLSLETYVAHQSRGMPIAVSIEGPARPHFEAGKKLFFTRFGQMNLSCAQCHDENWNRRLFAGPVTQGQPNGYPGYRLEWQTLGSLERRLRACLSGVRGEMFGYGAPEHADLELYLAWRAQGLPIEAPGVRR